MSTVVIFYWTCSTAAPLVISSRLPSSDTYSRCFLASFYFLAYLARLPRYTVSIVALWNLRALFLAHLFSIAEYEK
ncbi:hypothetical protein F4774DRAFT_374218 [Daldinia eschscholtzii]|nr:hypothetical protein F4774DRAFT_374218 [Daldinia eschscholtzii]